MSEIVTCSECGVLTRQITELESAQLRHLRLIRTMSNESINEEQAAELRDQIAKMIALVGSLRSQVATVCPACILAGYPPTCRETGAPCEECNGTGQRGALDFDTEPEPTGENALGRVHEARAALLGLRSGRAELVAVNDEADPARVRNPTATAKCDKCGRLTYVAQDLGDVCAMNLPDGELCPGVLR